MSHFHHREMIQLYFWLISIRRPFKTTLRIGVTHPPSLFHNQKHFLQILNEKIVFLRGISHDCLITRGVEKEGKRISKEKKSNQL